MPCFNLILAHVLPRSQSVVLPKTMLKSGFSEKNTTTGGENNYELKDNKNIIHSKTASYKSNRSKNKQSQRTKRLKSERGEHHEYVINYFLIIGSGY